MTIDGDPQGRLLSKCTACESEPADICQKCACVIGVQALRAALDARDPDRARHSRATATLAGAVARRLQHHRTQISDVQQLALIHDVGTIAIPDHILHKRGPLNAAQWQTMRRHPEIGARIVASIRPLDHLAPAVRAVHEWWDGSGYPDGLAGDRIPTASRTVLVCDAFQAMTSQRPYRKAMPLTGAVRGLRQLARTQFDPEVVAALLEEVQTARTPSASTADTETSVLVVADDAALRTALELGLERKGFRVSVAATATDAYDEVGETCFDLIVLDWLLLLGGDTGAVACRRLRYLHPGGEIVVFTGLSDVRDQRAALEAGANVVLQKGMGIEALAERLRGYAHVG